MLNNVDDITALQQSSLRRHASDMSWDYEKCESLCKDIVSQCSSSKALIPYNFIKCNLHNKNRMDSF